MRLKRTKSHQWCDSARGRKARGIAAEPLIYSARSGEYISDGANSPTRASNAKRCAAKRLAQILNLLIS
jgi:hypothetical protein